MQYKRHKIGIAQAYESMLNLRVLNHDRKPSQTQKMEKSYLHEEDVK